MKHAFIIDRDHNSNLAMMASGSFHKLDASYGFKLYDVDESNAYAQLMFETDFSPTSQPVGRRVLQLRLPRPKIATNPVS